MQARERRAVRLFIRRDIYDRYLSVLHLPAPRPLQHQRPAEVRADPRPGDRRWPDRPRLDRVQRQHQRVDHRTRALRGADAGGRDHPRTSTRRPRAPTDRRVPVLARGLPSRPCRPSMARRSARSSAAATSTPSPRPTRRTSRPASAAVDLGRLGGDPGRCRHRPGALLRARRPRRGGAAQDLPGGPAAVPVRGAPDALVDGRRGRRRATVRTGRGRPGLAHLRLRPAIRRAAAGAGARALLGRAAGDLGRLHRDRRVQRPRPARRR